MRVCWLFSCCLSAPNSPFPLGFVMLGQKVPFAAGPLSGSPTGGAAGELASWRRRDLDLWSACWPISNDSPPRRLQRLVPVPSYVPYLQD